jgi:hypothetical protein
LVKGEAPIKITIWDIAVEGETGKTKADTKSRTEKQTVKRILFDS